MLRLGHEHLPDACHLAHGSGKVGMQAEADRAEYRRAQAAGLVKVGPLGRQIEYVGGDLHRRIALRAAARNPHPLDRRAAAPFDALAAFAQGVDKAFENGAIEVGAGMHFAKADHRAFGFRPGHLDAGVPERLQHQAHRAGRHGIDQFVEQALGADATPVGLDFFMQAELFLEPVHHPEAAGDLDFRVVVSGHRRLERRDEARGLQVARRRGVDGGCGAEGKARDVGREATGADDFAGLVGGAGNHRQALRDAGIARGFGADHAESGAGRHQLRQHLALDGQALPFPVPRRRPAAALVVEGNVADLAGDRIDEAAGEAIVQVAGEQEVFVGLRPDRRLVLGDPVGFRFAGKVADGVAHADGTEGQFPPPGELRLGIAAPLIEPDNCGSQRVAVAVESDDRGALGGDDDAANRAPGNRSSGPELLTGLAKCCPELLGVVLHPARLRRLVAGDVDLRLVDQMPARVEDERPHALCAAVDGEKVILAQGALKLSEAAVVAVSPAPTCSHSLRRGDDGLLLPPQAVHAKRHPVAKPKDATAPHADALRRAGADHIAGPECHETRHMADDFGAGKDHVVDMGGKIAQRAVRGDQAGFFATPGAVANKLHGVSFSGW